MSAMQNIADALWAAGVEDLRSAEGRRLAPPMTRAEQRVITDILDRMRARRLAARSHHSGEQVDQ